MQFKSVDKIVHRFESLSNSTKISLDIDIAKNIFPNGSPLFKTFLYIYQAQYPKLNHFIMSQTFCNIDYKWFNQFEEKYLGKK